MSSISEVKKITGIEVRRIKHFTESGLLSVKARTGTGRSREYSLSNIIEIGICERLSSSGIALSKLQWIMATLLKDQIPFFIENAASDLPGIFLIVKEDDVKLSTFWDKNYKPGNEVVIDMTAANKAIVIRIDDLIESACKNNKINP